jgi:hypothetical protein
MSELNLEQRVDQLEVIESIKLLKYCLILRCRL